MLGGSYEGYWEYGKLVDGGFIFEDKLGTILLYTISAIV